MATMSEDTAAIESAIQQENKGWFSDWFKWSPTSFKLLKEAEHRVLSYVKAPYSGRYVSIGRNVGKKENHVWTISLNEDSPNVPLALVHGFGSGVAFWVLNLASLATNRPVHAFDLLGFGRSSRPSFDGDPGAAESQLVDSIEAWRRSMGIEKFVLLGHSMGGFLASSYATKYPERVEHLILADPWGFQSYRAVESRQIKIPLIYKIVIKLLSPFNPLAALRAAGPYGPSLVTRLRPELIEKFSPVVDDGNAIRNYIYHCNAQTPSGESAFKSMTERVGWPKNPMIERIGDVDSAVPITFIYGSTSWMDSSYGHKTKHIRTQSEVEVHEIAGAGHHVYADQAEIFNRLVNEACSKTSWHNSQS